MKPGGHFVCKVFDGSESAGLQSRLQTVFKKVERMKPEASRSQSKELYFVARDKRKDMKRSDVNW